MAGTLKKCAGYAGAGLFFSFSAAVQIYPFVEGFRERREPDASYAQAAEPPKLSEVLNSGAFMKDVEREMDIQRHCSGEASRRLCGVVGDIQLNGLKFYGPNKPDTNYNADRI